MMDFLNRLTTAVCCCGVAGGVAFATAGTFEQQPLRDEQTPAAVADLATLSKRVADLEQRVRKLETSTDAATASPAAEDLPVLEIHSETWCGPCQTLKADLAAVGETGVAVKWVRFSDRVPAMRWTGPDGKQIVQTGYTRGTIGSLLERVRAAHIARAAKSE